MAKEKYPTPKLTVMMGWESRASVLEDETLLTHRQAQIQALLEQGKSPREMADELGIDRQTVYEHRAVLRQRIEMAKSTAELARY